MGTPVTDPNLKVCRHCSVASRTEAATCPSCGRPYERRWWRWWFAIPIVAVAFGVGYFGISNLVFDDDARTGLTLDEANALNKGGPPGELEAVLDGDEPLDERRQKKGGFDFVCRYYTVIDADNTAWEACYLSGRLEISRALKLE
jgi:hypothetical protein